MIKSGGFGLPRSWSTYIKKCLIFFETSFFFTSLLSSFAFQEQKNISIFLESSLKLYWSKQTIYVSVTSEFLCRVVLFRLTIGVYFSFNRRFCHFLWQTQFNSFFRVCCCYTGASNMFSKFSENILCIFAKRSFTLCIICFIKAISFFLTREIQLSG